MIVSSAQHTVCFDSNRKPNPWWRSSRWNLPSSPVMPSPQLPVGCSTEGLRTRKSRFRCRFQLQLSSPTSLCRWTLEWRFLCKVVRGSLRCRDHSLWPWEYINSQPKGLSMGKKVASLPSAFFLPSPFPPSSFLLSLLSSHSSLLSSSPSFPFFPSNKWLLTPGQAYFKVIGVLLWKRWVLLCSRNSSGEKQISKQMNKIAFRW